jgi:hypothetical protein
MNLGAGEGKHGGLISLEEKRVQLDLFRVSDESDERMSILIYLFVHKYMQEVNNNPSATTVHSLELIISHIQPCLSSAPLDKSFMARKIIKKFFLGSNPATFLSSDGSLLFLFLFF